MGPGYVRVLQNGVRHNRDRTIQWSMVWYKTMVWGWVTMPNWKVKVRMTSIESQGQVKVTLILVVVYTIFVYTIAAECRIDLHTWHGTGPWSEEDGYWRSRSWMSGQRINVDSLLIILRGYAALCGCLCWVLVISTTKVILRLYFVAFHGWRKTPGTWCIPG